MEMCSQEKCTFIHFFNDLFFLTIKTSVRELNKEESSGNWKIKNKSLTVVLFKEIGAGRDSRLIPSHSGKFYIITMKSNIIEIYYLPYDKLQLPKILNVTYWIGLHK